MLVLAGYHPGVVAWEGSWTWDPLPLASIVGISALYAVGVFRLWKTAGVGHGLRRVHVASFVAGVLALGLALLSPLDRLSDYLFSAHMSQHELLMVVAAPLIILARPFAAYLWVLPRQGRVAVGHWLQRPRVHWAWQFLTAPLLVLVLHAAVRWIWHVPTLFEAAMQHDLLHAFQHLTFFASAALFWWALVNGRYGRAGYGLAVLFVFATAVHTSILGALISVAPRLLYPIYGSRTVSAGWAPLQDQEVAGLIMWVPSGILFLLTALALFAAWLGEAERRARRADGDRGALTAGPSAR
jgi:putative membrane protein